MFLALSSCSASTTIDVKNETIDNKKTTSPSKQSMHLPQASNVMVFEDALINVDYSNVNQGYIMVKTVTTAHQHLKVQIIKDEYTYNYDVNKDNEFEVFPLTCGNGTYTIKWLENVSDSKYALLGSMDIDVILDNETLPYLYPNQYVNYTNESLAVEKSFELVEGVDTQLQRVQRIYDYVISHVMYDWDKVEKVQGKFVLPNVDETLQTNKGICFDYASLMCAMLRCQNIPTKLVTGMISDGYHAWVEVYIDNIGWIAPHIYFNENEWTKIDATFDAMEQEYSEFYEQQYQY